MAPGVSQVLVYEGTTPNDVLNRMATDDLARQLSCSWGNFSPALDTNREQIYEQFAAQGQTMFQASGDDGAYTGEVSPPSDDPNITVVGGTSLTTSGFGGPWLGETTWSGSGGGSSITFPLPPWQQGLSTAANGGSTAFRNIPDVAAMADSAIWLVAFGGMQGSIGGTSAATPLWAGFAALANQQAAAEGKRPIGFINPLLYAIGRSASFTSSYHDIIAGNNTNSTSPTQFFAVPGYDLCTGWGSPTGSNLINALVSPPDALQIFPATNLMSSGPAGGRFDPTSQSMLLTNIGLASFNWTAASTAPWLDIVPDSGTGISNGPAAIVNLSLNSLASNLPPGNYTATIWFTNLNDGAGQSRQLNLNVIVTSSVPAIVGPPLSQTALPGETVIFTVMPVGNAPLSYQWQEDSTNLSDGGDISGSGTATLTISNVSSAFAGTYSVIVSNALNFATSDGAVLTVTSVTGAGVTITDLYSFTGGGDGANPNGLMQASDGNFYGTAENGGIDSSGTVFQMTPAGIVATMHQFGQSGGSGFSPQAGLVQGTNGALYGTTTDGGAHGWGTIFEITTNGGLTTVYMFDGGDGAFPQEPMILDTDGDFYGTTSGGGADEHGEVFRLTPAGALTQVVSFDYDNGVNPNTLLEGMDGTLYGTTFDGGTNGGGIIFNIATDGTLNTLFSFSYTNGGFLPAAGLAQSPEGDFYGTTFDGGTFGHGTIFAMSQSDIVQTSNSFTGGNDGGHPSADLLQASDGNYYGTTLDGGPYNAGTVFRWTPGGALVTLVTFDGFNGANPKSRLVQGLDGNLYGTTQNGGASSNGVVFRVNINSPIVQITGQPAAQNAFVGANAVFSVAVMGNPPIFYQWQKNGTNLADVSNISGSAIRVLTISDVGTSDAAQYSVVVSNAAGSAVVSDGATLDVIVSPPQIVTPPSDQTGSVGGTVRFNVAAIGDLPLSYQWQSNEVNLANGPTVSGATSSTLILGGLTQRSAGTYTVIVSNAVGSASASATLVVHPVSATGTLASSLYWFTGGADGGTPNGLTLASNGVLYGTTQAGGDYGGGTVFSITADGVFQTLVQFATTNGSNPQAALTQGADGNFYGTTEGGGTNGDGTVFKMTPDGALTTLVAFTNATSANPYVALVQGTNGNFYGATQNGSRPGDGNIFEMTPAGSLNVIYSFTGGQDGNEPIGALTQGTDGNFYATTTAGCAHNFGGVFRMTPDGALTNLYSFTGAADGYNPYGAPVQGTDGFFYGVTRRNVIANLPFYGTIFKFSTNGTLTTLYANNPSITGDGEYPFAGLIQGADGNFYGTTLYGSSTMNGTVFRVTAAGDYATLTTFNGSDDGAQPKAAMVQDAEGNFYGTTTAGGPYGKGSIFRLSITSAPQITLQPSNQTALIGSVAQFSVSVFGASPLGYQWQKNGGNVMDDGRIVGAASRILTINDVSANDAGTYSVIVSNGLGSVVSSDAVLTVAGPPVLQSVVTGAGTLAFTWSAATGESYEVQTTTNLASTNWLDLGGIMTATNTNMSGSFGIGSNSQQFYRVLLLP
jgi:uncharacterized repeat protein (TIGR03803 family)